MKASENPSCKSVRSIHGWQQNRGFKQHWFSFSSWSKGQATLSCPTAMHTEASIEELSVVRSMFWCIFAMIPNVVFAQLFLAKQYRSWGGGAMCDTKWGFNTNYGHRTLPFKWQSSNGFHFYEDKAVGSFSVSYYH